MTLHVHLDLGLNVAHVGHLDLDVCDLSLADLHRKLRRLIAVRARLHRDKNHYDDDRQADAGENCDFLFALRWTHCRS
jgi:hypothetical protein